MFRLTKCLELEAVNAKSNQLNSLMDSFNSSSSSEEKKNMFVDESTQDALNIVILNAEDTFYGIIVDEILDTEEIVVKPLSSSSKQLNLFGGATIMGDGHVALILDALGFLNTISTIKDVSDDQENISMIDQKKEVHNDVQENLIVTLEDDRLYAIPISLVSRLEEFPMNKIETTGSQPVIRYLDKPMPLIDIEKTLHLDSRSKLARGAQNHEDVISCIVTTIRGRNYGLIVKEI